MMAAVPRPTTPTDMPTRILEDSMLFGTPGEPDPPTEWVPRSDLSPSGSLPDVDERTTPVLHFSEGRPDPDPSLATSGMTLSQLLLFAESTPLAVIEWADDSSVTFWSARAEVLFGWTESEARAMNPTEWQFTHPADTPAAREALTLHRSGIPGQGGLARPIRNYARDGSLLHCEWFNVVLPAKEGSAVSVLSLVHDVTARVKAEEAKAALLARQTRIAETLQRSLLQIPAGRLLRGLELSILCVSALEEAYVGGDFYDAFSLGDHRAALVLGDVTGKGLRAAAFLAETKFALRAFLREHGDAAVALRQLNRFFFNTIRHDSPGRTEFAAVSIAIFDSAQGMLEVATAGAEPPVLRSSDRGVVSARELPASGAILGSDPEARYDVVRWRLAPGDVLCMVTDGITEARRVTKGSHTSERVRYYEFFGLDGVRRMAETHLTTGGDLDGFAKDVLEEARAFAGGSLTDDVCLLTARWQPE